MTDHKLKVRDEVKGNDAIASQPPATVRKYKVIAENGLFKNGMKSNYGGTIELNDGAARAFLDAGDIEAIEEDSGDSSDEQ